MFSFTFAFFLLWETQLWFFHFIYWNGNSNCLTVYYNNFQLLKVENNVFTCIRILMHVTTPPSLTLDQWNACGNLFSSWVVDISLWLYCSEPPNNERSNSMNKFITFESQRRIILGRFGKMTMYLWSFRGNKNTNKNKSQENIL